MGEYPVFIMEDVRKDKVKRQKHDSVSQAVYTYLQRRNYNITPPTEISQQELALDMLVDREIGRPNAVMYSCYTSDPTILEHSYIKFITWLKEINKIKDCKDLYNIVGPLFCHIYLEMLQRGHTDKAANFMKSHISQIDQTKCDETVTKLLNVFSNDISDGNGLKKKFSANKYTINFSSTSVKVLKTFLAESCHMLMLQMFHTCFEVNETNATEVLDETSVNKVGFSELRPSGAIERLKVIANSIKNDNSLIYSVGLTNLKDDVTCGLINRERGLCVYCYNSGVFLTSLGTLKQLDGTEEFCDVVFREHRKRVYDVTYIKNYNYLVSASQDSTIRLFDLNDYSQKLVYSGHNYPVYCVTANKNGDYIASGSYDHSARLWSVETSNTLRVYVGHTQEVTSVNFHVNGLYFCTGSADKAVRMWSINEPNPVRLFLGSKGIVYSVAFSSNGKYLASAGDDKRLRIWDLVAGKQIFELKVGVDPIVKLRWKEDDTMLCAGTIDGLVRTWDVNNIVNSGDLGQYSPRCSVNLGTKLLDVESSFGSFACLTAKTKVSTVS